MESPDLIRRRQVYPTPPTRINGVGVDRCVMHADRDVGGGDWCEAFAVGDDVVALSIGDVCGHGVAKMHVMEALRDRLHDALAHGRSPSEALEEANGFLRAYDEEENATAIVALLDIARRTLTFVNAGHPAPLVAGPYGATYLEFSPPDVPLGVCATIDAVTHVVGIAASALIVLYTDGVSEHDRDPLTGAAQLFAATVVAHATPARDPAAFLRERMSLTGTTRDDAAILAVRMPLAPIVRRQSGSRRSSAAAQVYS